MALATVWAEGQGMHLSANSIGHLLSEMKNSDIYDLTHFYDEDLSHYLWHLGIVGLSALIISRQWHNPFEGQSEGKVAVIAGGVIYSITYFAAVIEAGTAPLGLPFAFAAAVFGLIWGRGHFKQQPMTTFFVTAYALATIMFIIWALIHGGLPDFSELGWF